MKSFYLFLTLFFYTNAYSQSFPYFCTEELDDLPVLAGGRIKPLYVHAKETLKFLNDAKDVNENLSVTQIYCLLSLKSLGIPSTLKLSSKVEHTKTLELLGVTGDHKVPMPLLITFKEKIEQEIMTLKLNDAYKKELNKILGKIDLFNQITTGSDWKIPIGKKPEWKTLTTELTEEKITLLKTQSNDPFKKFFGDVKSDYQKNHGDGYLLELIYVKANIFSWALAVTLAAIFTTTLIKNNVWGMAMSLLTIIIQVTAIVMRVYISGRAPITNMYETVMFSGFGALLIGLLMTQIKKEKIYLIAGLSYNFLCLLMMMFANSMLSSAISPLVPVLRDNFWLSTHVSMVILSYAALALSWIISNITMVKEAYGLMTKEEFAYNIKLTYTCIKVGTVMLATGIILGGIWADYSWGRFWGWDPKETWSLIVFMIYMAIVHGKNTSWIDNFRFNFFVAGAFMSVMMAWFGVNYILASGLHSYGFSEGGAIFLGSFFIIQISLMIFCYFKRGPLTTQLSK